MGVIEAVTDPDAFFAEEFPDGRLNVAGKVVLAFLVAFAVAMVAIGQTAIAAVDLSAAERAKFQSSLFGAILIAGLSTLVGLLILAGLYHLGTALAGGSGSFSDTLIVAAWGMVPSIVGIVVGAALFVITFDPGGASAGPEALARSLLRSQSHPLQLLVTLVVTGWQVYVVSHGLKHARNVGMGAAAAVAVVVTLLGLVAQLG